MSIIKYLIICCLGMGCWISERAFSAEPFSAGPLYDEFPLTLAPGHRTEIFGPLFYSEQKESQHTWAIPPLTLAHTSDPSLQLDEYEFAYPILTYRRFGPEYRWQFFQAFSFAGGQNEKENPNRRFTLFPIYFQQRSPDPEQNYTAVVPLYGQLKHRLFRDEIDFVLFPCYSKTRKGDVVTRNMPYPFFHLRQGNGLHGWQVWPLVGHEHKDVTTRTNGFGDVEVVDGHDNFFAPWPFYLRTTNGIGTTNLATIKSVIPLYLQYRSDQRDSSTYFWPLGVTHTVDREKKYTEWDAPWPMIVFARGEGKTTSRVWPFYSRARNKTQESDWYLWPVYKYQRFHSGPLDWERTRSLFFLYSALSEKNTETGRTMHRTDLWPLFTHRRDFNGNERLQILSVIEPVLPDNESVERVYSHVYSLWRAEKNAGTGANSQSLLWNLYRRDAAPGTKKISLCLGLFQYQSTPEGSQWRLCYIPMGKAKKPLPGQSPGH